MITEVEEMQIQQETDKKMLAFKERYFPEPMKGFLLKDCPRCKMKDTVGIFISLNNPCYIACRICNEVLTEIEVKDLSKLYKNG